MSCAAAAGTSAVDDASTSATANADRLRVIAAPRGELVRCAHARRQLSIPSHPSTFANNVKPQKQGDRPDVFLYHPRGSMYQDDGDLDQRLARFEAQLDRFNLALHQWQHPQDAPPAPPRARAQRIPPLQ